MGRTQSRAAEMLERKNIFIPITQAYVGRRKENGLFFFPQFLPTLENVGRFKEEKIMKR